MNVTLRTIDAQRSRLVATVVATTLAVSVLAGPAAPLLSAAGGRTVSVIVRELPGSGDGLERMVEGFGGDVGRHIGIIDGFFAELPECGIGWLEELAGVHSVTQSWSGNAWSGSNWA